MSAGLVLEGGGMRGIYTAGVLDCFLDNDVMFNYVIGVSAGGNMAASYLSKQRGRNKKVSLEFLDDKRYLSFANYIKNREMFGMDFIFDEIPKTYAPFDMDEFLQYNGEYIIACTNCETGETEYYNQKYLKKDLMTILRASSSLPFMAPIVEYDGKKLLDGGITDPIPLRKAQRDGMVKNVVVLTRPAGYVKRTSRFAKWIKLKGYKKIDEAMLKRAGHYNETLNYIEQQEENGHVIVIRPSQDLKVDRMEKDKNKLSQLYDLGYNDALKQIEAIKKLKKD
ncbi:patatin-like phospholipase family protein [Macrococcus armenti]|uniref:Patatin family protein n=1 Tax=Macrococcus armenti TaxID=2875764 RepID=A0ABY3ZU96_9STAP|nr:patatin family protein [Macrococcus armenti]UOB20481.1 patatin family protein [Macrococcus armenti]